MFTPRWPPRRIWQRGEGVLSLLMPLARAGAKAIATGVLSGAAGWGVKKALTSATSKRHR